MISRIPCHSVRGHGEAERQPQTPRLPRWNRASGRTSSCAAASSAGV